MQVNTDYNVLKVLTYFDLFDYPLSKDDIRHYLEHPVDEHELAKALDRLLRERRIFLYGGFYMLQNRPTLAIRRKDGNARARQLLITGYRIAAFLYRFPFVQGVFISGSLSKDFADESADIDYFIITSANRLWIARTMMHLFKKLTFLTGRQHWYCMNYYIDEEAMKIEEQNIFTATEMITLLPACGNGTVDRFFDANEWTRHFYPGYGRRQSYWKEKKEKHRLKRCLEYVFNNRMGDWLDKYLMHLTSKRWQKKEEAKRLNIAGGRMGIRTGRHFCKPNPAFFQHKLLERYRQRWEAVERMYRLPEEPGFRISSAI